MFRPRFAGVAFTMLMPVAAVADVVTMNNGDRLTGTVVSMSDNALVLDSEYNGELTLPWVEIADLQTDEPVRLRTTGGETLVGRISGIEDGRVRFAEAREPVMLAEVTAVNPPESDVTTGGFVDAGATLSRGNTESESYSLAGEFVARTPRNRFIVGGQYYREKDDEALTAENARLYGRYARFISEKWFLGTNLSFEHDPFEDLDLRTTLGAGIGYQAFDRNDLSLSFEAGANYVREDLDEGEDDSYPAGRLALDYSQAIIGGARLFHISELLPPLDAPDEYLFNSRTGVRVPLLTGLSGTFQVDFDYNNDPPAGTESADTIYQFKLGYSW